MTCEIAVLIGAGMIGQAIIRRVGIGRRILVGDFKAENAERVVQTLYDAGFEAEATMVDVASRDSIRELVEKAASFGSITRLVHAAGVSPSQAPIERILQVDLYGTAVILEEFGQVIASGGSGVVISSQSGHRLGSLSNEENALLAKTPPEELLQLPMLQREKVRDTLLAYQLSKRCNGLRVAYESTRWGKRGARINAISPGIIITPLANDELNGPRGEGYRRMIETCPVGRAGTPDDVANVAELLLSDRGSFITGSDFLMDGGVTATWWYGEYPKAAP